MKKNYLKSAFLSAGFLLSSLSFAQVNSFPFFEGFEENSPTRGQWTQIYEHLNMAWTFTNSPSTGSWIGNGNAAYEGTIMANFPGNSHQFDKTKLVSPVLNLSEMGSASLEFFFRNPFWSPDQNFLRVYYRTSADSPWNLLETYHSDVPNWTTSGVINLPNLSATYQIALECETDYGYSTTVDAVTVSATPLSIRENHEIAVNYYPNPVKDLLQFNSHETIESIRVYNLFGQKVFEQKVNAQDGRVNLSHLTTGQYIVQAENSNGISSYKFMKQ